MFVDPDIGLEWQAILNARGWAAPHWPVEDGGPGWTPVQRYVFDKECALAGTPALAVLGLKLVGPIICRFGTPAQKARFLPRILTGEDAWCQGYSEPGSGSDLASLKTRAIRDGDIYTVDGSKIWTTHAQYADWMFALVRTSTEGSPQSGISFLLIPMHQPGISVTPIITLAGDHEVNAVFLDGATTGAENLIGAEGQGWSIAKFLLETERGGSCHAPRILVDLDRLALLAADVPSGVNGAMSHDHDFRLRLARLRLEARALEVTELRILADIAAGRPAGPQTSLTKLVAAGLTQRVDALAVDAVRLRRAAAAARTPAVWQFRAAADRQPRRADGDPALSQLARLGRSSAAPTKCRRTSSPRRCSGCDPRRTAARGAFACHARLLSFDRGDGHGDTLGS